METDKLQIIMLKFNDCVYIADPTRTKSYDSYSRITSGYKFDGVDGEGTNFNVWLRLDKEPTMITKNGTTKCINYRYTLIDKSLASDKIPLTLIRDDVIEYDEDNDVIWKSEWKHLQSLYELEYDTITTDDIPVEFEMVDIIIFDNSGYPPSIKYSVNGEYNKPNAWKITNRDVKHQLLDELIFPSPSIHTRPCTVSSEDAYRIIRQYVKNNIDPKWAEITSDYSFCFTVKKKIEFTKPYSIEREIKKSNGKSYRKPKFQTLFSNYRSEVVFEMTSAEDKYKGYTIIPEFVGEDEEDLKQTIDAYLEHLMSVINEPLIDCPCCGGTGVKCENGD